MYIDHIAVWVENLENEKNFFLKYFDCTVNEKYVNPVKGFSSYFVTFRSGGRIELMNRSDISGTKIPESLGFTHISINVGSREKVDRLTEVLEKDGFIIIGRPRITGDGYYESLVLDPESNYIEIMSI